MMDHPEDSGGRQRGAATSEPVELDLVAAYENLPDVSRACAFEGPDVASRVQSMATAGGDTIQRTLDRVDEAEEMLLEGASEQRVAGLLAAKWDISRRRAQPYVTCALRRMWEDGQRAREEKRALARARAQRVYARAMAHRKAVVVGKGAEAYVELVDDPNESAAIKALDLECRIDGLLDEKPVQQNEVRVMVVDRGGLREELERRKVGAGRNDK